MKVFKNMVLFVIFTGLLFSLSSCSSLISPDTKKVSVNVNCSVPGARQTFVSPSLNELDEAATRFASSFNDKSITLTVKGSGVNYENTILLEEAARIYFLKMAASSMEPSNVSIPVSFYVSELPVEKSLTFKAKYSYKDDTGKTVTKQSKAVTRKLHEGENISITLDTTKGDLVYDWNTKAQASLNSILNAGETFEGDIYIASTFSSEADGSLNKPYTLKEFLTLAQYKTYGEGSKFHLILKEDVILGSEQITIANNYNNYIDLNGHKITVKDIPAKQSDTDIVKTICTDQTNTHNLFIYNGIITTTAVTSLDYYIFAEQYAGTLKFNNIVFESFNQRILNIPDKGDFYFEYCKFNNCKFTNYATYLISMYTLDSATEFSTLNLTGCRFNKCNAWYNSLIRVKGTLNVDDTVIEIDGYQTPATGDTAYYGSIFIIKSASTVNFKGSKLIDYNSTTPLIEFNYTYDPSISTNNSSINFKSYEQADSHLAEYPEPVIECSASNTNPIAHYYNAREKAEVTGDVTYQNQ